MKGEITVLPQDEWEEWYASTGNGSATGGSSADLGTVGVAGPSGVSA
jgi:cytochrome c oxidase subunit 2